MKPEPRPAIHVGKQVGWAPKLGGVESLGISWVGQTLLAWWMESQIWHQPAISVTLCGVGSEKVQWPLFALMPDTSVPPPYATAAFPATLVL